MSKGAMPTSNAKTAYGLLSEVRRLILAEPLCFNQHTYIARRRDGAVAEKEWPSWGIIGCVACLIAVLKATHDLLGYYEIAPCASAILNLSPNQEKWLFDAKAAGHETQTPEHAKRGAAHIAEFQKAYAKQLKATKV